ncbi:hypothetical protein KC19_8G064400 [Ceratodon purpureus]|uniref:Uncharacterized protein n=1 Tax=Ceratodon purpureus TaxID=3225 RepID=A0A8T0GXU9_CERPU|nr:hypothetical protein KC19_8G064400 [Ceratodon purpureus]
MKCDSTQNFLLFNLSKYPLCCFIITKLKEHSFKRLMEKRLTTHLRTFNWFEDIFLGRVRPTRRHCASSLVMQSQGMSARLSSPPDHKLTPLPLPFPTTASLPRLSFPNEPQSGQNYTQPKSKRRVEGNSRELRSVVDSSSSQ